MNGFDKASEFSCFFLKSTWKTAWNFSLEVLRFSKARKKLRVFLRVIRTVNESLDCSRNLKLQRIKMQMRGKAISKFSGFVKLTRKKFFLVFWSERGRPIWSFYVQVAFRAVFPVPKNLNEFRDSIFFFFFIFLHAPPATNYFQIHD